MERIKEMVREEEIKFTEPEGGQAQERHPVGGDETATHQDPEEHRE